MRGKLHIVVGSLLVMAACDAAPEAASASANDANTPEAAPVDPLKAAAARPGPYMVTYSDGTVLVSYASEDGTDWSAGLNEPPGGGTARWSVIGGNICVDAAQDDRDPEDTCLIADEAGADGTWQVRSTERRNAAPMAMQRLDAEVSGRADQVAAGAYLLEISEGNHLLAIFAEDGRAFLGAEPLSLPWRAAGNQRCFVEEGVEDVCITLLSQTDEDGVFTGEEDGEAVTFELL